MVIPLVVLTLTLTLTPVSIKSNLQTAQEGSTCIFKSMMKVISFRYLRRSLTITRITLLSVYQKVLYEVPMVLNDPRS